MKVRASQRDPAYATRSVIAPHVIRAMEDRGARLLTVEPGERPCYSLPITVALLIGRRLRFRTGQRV